MNKKIILPIIIGIGVILLGGGVYVLNGKNNDKNIHLANKIDTQVDDNDIKKEINTTEVNTTEVRKSQNNGTENAETQKIDEQSAKKEESNSKVEKTENNQSKTSNDSKKAQYIIELNNLKTSTDKAITGKVQIEMNMQAEEVYKQWDTELNNIWKELEIKLPKEEMNNLRQKQNGWIKEKEAKKKQTEEKYGEVTSASFKVFTTLTEMTKERCYYLVNNYM